jgi:hypothetical protein
MLISKLQEKSASINQQLEVITIREKQGLDVDYTRVKRSIFARAQTNKSISALQRILKKRRQQLALRSDTSFEKVFFEAAKEMLTIEEFRDIMELTFTKLKELGNLQNT